jgi:hypothetical protein
MPKGGVVARKKNKILPAKPSVFIYPKSVDDLSSHGHRLMIGFLGAILPIALWIVSCLRPVTSAPPPEPFKSISVYFYSGAGMIFAGVLVALAVFFFTYRGYRNQDHWKDLLAAFIAGAAAITVAVFPTDPAPLGVPEPLWWNPIMGKIHLVAAGVLFISFIVFSVVLFPISKNPRNFAHFKKGRNQVYYLCGAVMAGCVVYIAFQNGQTDPIFWPESIALEFFAISWFAKAHADWTLGQIGKRVFGAKRP